MSSYNRVLLLGTLGQTPVLRNTQNGKPFCRLSLATESWKGESGENRTSWHAIHVFGKEAENATRFLRKGRQVFVEGRIENSQSEKNGTKTWNTWITAQRVTFLNGNADKLADETNTSQAAISEFLSPEDENENRNSEEFESSLGQITH